jgi:hypothetical protein
MVTIVMDVYLIPVTKNLVFVEIHVNLDGNMYSRGGVIYVYKQCFYLSYTTNELINYQEKFAGKRNNDNIYIFKTDKH